MVFGSGTTGSPPHAATNSSVPRKIRETGAVGRMGVLSSSLLDTSGGRCIRIGIDQPIFRSFGGPLMDHSSPGPMYARLSRALTPGTLRQEGLKLSILAGDGQQAATGTPVPDPVQVRVVSTSSLVGPGTPPAPPIPPTASPAHPAEAERAGPSPSLPRLLPRRPPTPLTSPSGTGTRTAASRHRPAAVCSPDPASFRSARSRP